ncbi:calcium-binding protein-like protein [Leptotrombidium deliense]|uniref:Calcium-binding protein-like protein n=1 Tax=Leptotrombidium deliense TaxID=299467 RepID=A0A443RZI4_9ACAR|nr:calcium-binding protein-like protein [Leptotrombidium deliense]
MSEYKYTPVCGLFNLGEGPHWKQSNECVYFVDAFVGDVCRFDTKSSEVERKRVGGTVTIIIPWHESEDHFVVSKDHELLQYEWSTGKTKSLTFVENDLPTRFNDGKCDRNNRLWIGTMGHETSPAVVPPEMGSLYCINKDYSVKRRVQNVSLSNGIAWSPDNKLMYFADSVKREVYVFDYEAETGDVSNQRTFFDYEKHGKPDEVPDGMTIDVTGKIWVANWSGGRLIRLDPETSKIINEVNFEKVSRVTSLCFGGTQLNKLYVTSSWRGLSDEQRTAQPTAGSLFEVTFPKENIKGFLGDSFNGNNI